MKKNVQFILVFIIIVLIIPSCAPATETDYPISSVRFADVNLTDDFWTGMIDRNREVTLPYVLEELKSRNSLNGSGISKVIEGISYYLMTERDIELEALADTLISYIKETQHEDGYIGRGRLNTDGTPMADSLLWLGTDDFGETGGSSMLYGLGHLYEAAVAHYQATGKTSLIEIAEKNATMLLSVFGHDKLKSYPFHPEIELALVKLYRATGKKEYLELSRFFLDSRGPGGTEYSQSHLKIVDQREATGHAVRALYLYSGITDIVALNRDKDYEVAINAIWNSVVDSKLYITGGMGAYADHEAFGEPYSLPNATAYNETCASIAAVLWSHRMFLLNGNAEYIDVLERTLYNSLPDGISVTGDRFFYPNPLESTGQYQRASWYGVPCCLTNIIRFLPQVPGFIYASKGNELFVNLFISNNCAIELAGGKVNIIQETGYPWQGDVKIVVDPAESFDFTLRIRIPGWAINKPVPSDLYEIMDKQKEKVRITLNGEPYSYKTEDGYAIIKRKWSPGDIVNMDLPMEVQKITANNRIEDDRAKFAIQRGPVVYCLEGPDNRDGLVSNLMIPAEAEFTLEPNDAFSDGGFELVTSGYSYMEDRNSNQVFSVQQDIKAIPYYMWANRGPAEMVVWIPYDESTTTPYPDPPPSIASQSTILSSHDTITLSGINDNKIIPYNQNIPISNYYRWPMVDTIQWVQYLFDKDETVSSVEVYWYDNEPSRMTTWYNGMPWTCCRVPDSWEIFYLDNNNDWQPVRALNEYGTMKHTYNRVNFEPVNTKSLKMVVERHETCASGLQEWVVN